MDPGKTWFFTPGLKEFRFRFFHFALENVQAVGATRA